MRKIVWMQRYKAGARSGTHFDRKVAVRPYKHRADSRDEIIYGHEPEAARSGGRVALAKYVNFLTTISLPTAK